MDADPRNLAYLRTSLDLNNSTNNVRILYNAVRYRCTDKATIRYKPCCYFDVSSTSNENTTLYPMIPDPRNEGGVRMYTEQRLLAENLNVTQFTQMP